MGKIFIVFCISLSFLYSIENLKPTYSLQASGDVQDIIYTNDVLYAATSEGTIDIFDTKNQKKVSQIKVPNIKDFMGDNVPAKMYSVDIYDGKLAFVSQGMKGYRNLWIYENDQLTKVLGIDKKLFIKKARFIDKNTILLATLSNEIILFDTQKGVYLYTIQISGSSFSDFSLDEEKKFIVATDESGIVRRIDVKSGNINTIIGKKNLDRVYQLDYKNGVVLTAGQDRKTVIYKQKTTLELDFHFLLYSCGLSPDGEIAAIAYKENNDLLVFQTSNLKKLYNLTQNKATLTQIKFIDDKQLFASSDSAQINYWRLP